MKNMTLEKIAQACGGRLMGGASAAGITTILTREAAGVVIDSRKAEKDFVFIAARGERVDGHRFIEDVFEKGALAVVCERLPEKGLYSGPCILVEDSFEALKRIAEFYRSQLSVKVVGITGSVGKTSTKEFVASVLAQKYRVHKTQGNFNNEIGVPLTVLAMPEDTEVAVLEMGINHFGEMHNLSRIARPDLCIMTNIGQCHLEFLGSRAGILKAKSEIFDFMAEDGSVCVNGDDDMLCTVPERNGKKPLMFGKDSANAVYAEEIENKGLFGSKAVICGNGMRIPVQIPLPGDHMVYNALAAASAGLVLGLDAQQIAQGIAAVQATGGRSNIIQTEDHVLIDDCYNANPVSMMAAIDLLMTAKGRKVAVLGDMFELGEKELELHAQVGRYAAEMGVDCILAAGERCKVLCEAAGEYCREQCEAVGKETALQSETGSESGCGIHWFADRDALMTELPGLLQKEDTILVKASNGMGYSAIVKLLTGESSR